MTDRNDLYADVTNAIVAQLETGVRPWSKPWEGGAGCMPIMPLRVNGERYQGINILLLWGAMQAKGYTQPVFMTFNQAKELGGCVRKGEKASRVVYAGAVEREQEGDKGEAETVRIPFLKQYAVFNVEQIEGLPARFIKASEPVAAPEGPAPIDHAETYFASLDSVVRNGGDRAFYCPSSDHIQMPALAAFKDAESYYATLAHEHVHWTGAETRLARTFGKRFGDEAYAVEELVAEIGAAFVAAELGLYLEPREDHAAYLASWLKVLMADKRAIFTAASAAQKAVDHLNAQAMALPVAKAA